MTVKIINRETHTTFQLNGDFDLYTSPKVRTLILERMEGKNLPVIVDMTLVPYLDSSGVGTIIRMLQAAAAQSKKIGFCGIQQTPLKVLEMANITSLINPYQTENQALTALTT